MWFWWFMFISDLLIPLVMIVGGRLMWKSSPKKINAIYGYRTSRSMKNLDTWQFAHRYIGRLWWIIGWISIVPSVIVMLPFIGQSDDAISLVGGIMMMVQMTVLIITVIPTEMALKRTFDENGERRSEGTK